MDQFMLEALDQARKSLSQGGIPIGSVLVIDGKIVGSGHNQRVQKKSTVFHAEMDCLENAGRLTSADYQRSVLYTTLSPCPMCSGAVLLYRIPRVVIGENVNYIGAEDRLRQNNVELNILNDPGCISLMREFIRASPELWHEDIGMELY
jgi:cytosine/creatinine deaminase